MRRLPILTTTFATCLALTAGCSDTTDDGDANDHAMPGSALSAHTMTAEQQDVLAAFDKYWSVCVAGAEKDPLAAKQYLAECVSEPFLTPFASIVVNKYTIQGLRFEGRETITYQTKPPEMDTPQPGQATVRSCDDTSNYYLVKDRSGKIKQAGHRRDSSDTILTKTSRGWEVTQIVVPANPQVNC